MGPAFEDVEAGGIGLWPAAPGFLDAFLRVEGLERAGVVEADAIIPGGAGGGVVAGGGTSADGAAVGARGDRRETGEGDDGAAGRFGDFMRRSVPPEGDPGQANRGRTAVGVQWFWGIDSSELRGRSRNGIPGFWWMP